MPSPYEYFGVTPPGNPLSQFFPQRGGDDSLRSQLEERPVNRLNIPPEYAIAAQMPDPQGFLGQVQAIRGQSEAQKLIGELDDLPFGTKDYGSSMAKLFSKYPLGAQNPAAQNILKMKALSGQQAQDSRYSSQAAQAAKDFLSIGEGDPEYASKFQSFVQGLDPEVLQHPRLTSLIDRGMHNAASMKSRRKTDEEVDRVTGLKLAQAGIHPDQFKDYRGANGLFDPYKAAFALGEAERGVKAKNDALSPSSKQKDELYSIVEGLHTPDDKAKLEAWNTANKTSKYGWQLTPEQWKEADGFAKAANLQKLQGLVQQYHDSGIKVPKAVLDTANLPTENEKRIPAEAVALVAAPMNFKTVEEVPADLPKGTIIIINGRKARID